MPETNGATKPVVGTKAKSKSLDMVCRDRKLPDTDDTNGSTTVGRPERIYRTMRVKLYSLTLLHIKNPDDAGDVVQNIFVRLLSGAQIPHAKSDLESYLSVAIRNEAEHIYSKHMNAKRKCERLNIENRHQPVSTPYDDLNIQETREAIRDCLYMLPIKRRRAFLLVDIHGYTYRLAAARMKISVKTLEMHVRLAREALGQSKNLQRMR